jgi:hypothetical protein
MKYTKPQLLNVKRASHAIMGFKQTNTRDGSNMHSTNSAYQSDE